MRPPYARRMSNQRAALISVCSALARLQVKVLDKLAEGRRMPNGVIRHAVDSGWMVADLKPPSPWFDQLTPSADLQSVVPRIARVQAHLLGMLEKGEIDARKACRILQHICGTGDWSAMVLRVAKRLGISLASSPVEEMHHTFPAHDPFPQRPRAKKDAPP